MASTSLTFDIYARDRASQTFKNVAKAADSTDKSMSGFHKTMGAVAGLVAGVGIASGVKNLVEMGVKTAAANEQAQISFTSLLGSAGKAKGFLKDLTSFAAKTPFDLPGVELAAQQLLGVGQSSKQVIPFLTAFGNTASALGLQTDQFNSVMQQTTQAIANGKFQIGDLSALASNGIPIYKLLSEAMHKPASAIADMATKGKLTATQVLPLLQKQMNKDYGGSMAKQSQTLNGLWSTFQDTLSQGLAKALTGVLPLLKNGLGKASQFLATVLPKVATALKNFITGMKNGTGPGGALVKVFHALQAVWKAVVPVLASVFGWMGKNKAVVGTFAGVIGAVVVAVKAWRAAQVVLDAVLAANPIGIVVVAIAALAAGLVYAYQHSKTFRTICQDAFHAVAAAGKWMWNNVLQPVFKFLVQAIAFVMNMWAKMLGALGHVPGFGWAKTASQVMHDAADKANDLANGIQKIPNDTTANVHVNGIAAAIQATKSYQDMLRNLNGSVANTYVRQIITKGPVAGGGHPIAPRAAGGPVSAGVTYLVGEKGPELFTAPASGRIIPNHKIHHGPDLKGMAVTLTNAGKHFLDGLVSGIESGRVKLSTALDKVKAAVAKATAHLKDLLSQRNDFANGFLGFGGSVFGQTFANGNSFQSASDVLNAQAASLAHAQQVQADVKALTKMGLSPALIKQMQAAGDSGFATMGALTKGTPQQIALLNRMNAQTNSALMGAGMTAGNAVYGDQIQSARSAVANAKAMERVLERWARRQDKNTVVELHIDGKVLHGSLLRLKHKSGNKKLGLA